MYFPGKINQPPFLRTAVAEGKKKEQQKKKESKIHFWQNVKNTKACLNLSPGFTQNQSPWLFDIINYSVSFPARI